MEVCTLASGSSGNCLLVRSERRTILLDAGISARRITNSLKELDISAAELDAILITHAHSDHISGLATLTKKLRIPIYLSRLCAGELMEKVPHAADLLCPVEAGGMVEIGDMVCRCFSIPHDSPGSMGWSISAQGCKMALATDLGHVTPQVLEGISGCDLLVAECNHDESWVRTGPYPPYLQERILGKFGHLSNEAGAQLIRQAVESGTHTVLLAHLSSDNNTPSRARSVVERCLRSAGIDPQRDIELAVAPRSERGRLYHLACRTAAEHAE